MTCASLHRIRFGKKINNKKKKVISLGDEIGMIANY